MYANLTNPLRPITQELSPRVIPDWLLPKPEGDLWSCVGHLTFITLAHFLPCVRFVCLSICFLTEVTLDPNNVCVPRDHQSAWNMVGHQFMLLEGIKTNDIFKWTFIQNESVSSLISARFCIIFPPFAPATIGHVLLLELFHASSCLRAFAAVVSLPSMLFPR